MPGLSDRFFGSVGRQLSNPTGAAGRLIGGVMSVTNRRPTEALIDALQVRHEHRVLDIGCGNGTALAALPHVAWRCGLDQSETMLAVARRRLHAAIEKGRAEFRLGDMMNLPFEANSFDRFIASNTLYFCNDVPHFILECQRIAKPGAMLGIYVTSAKWMEKWRFAGPATHRHFSRQQLEVELDRAGIGPGNRSIRSISLPGRIEGLIAVARLH